MPSAMSEALVIRVNSKRLRTNACLTVCLSIPRIIFMSNFRWCGLMVEIRFKPENPAPASSIREGGSGFAAALPVVLFNPALSRPYGFSYFAMS